MINYILPILIGIALVFAIRKIIKQRKTGCTSCRSCSYNAQCKPKKNIN